MVCSYICPFRVCLFLCVCLFACVCCCVCVMSISCFDVLFALLLFPDYVLVLFYVIHDVRKIVCECFPWSC